MTRALGIGVSLIYPVGVVSTPCSVSITCLGALAACTASLFKPVAAVCLVLFLVLVATLELRGTGFTVTSCSADVDTVAGVAGVGVLELLEVLEALEVGVDTGGVLSPVN